MAWAASVHRSGAGCMLGQGMCFHIPCRLSILALKLHCAKHCEVAPGRELPPWSAAQCSTLHEMCVSVWGWSPTAAPRSPAAMHARSRRVALRARESDEAAIVGCEPHLGGGWHEVSFTFLLFIANDCKGHRSLLQGTCGVPHRRHHEVLGQVHECHVVACLALHLGA